MEPAAEDSVIEQAQRGSVAAFTRLIETHQQAVRAFLRRLSGDHAEADDLAQDSFVTAWARLRTFQHSRDFRLWLYGIAYRKFLGGQRAARRRQVREQLAAVAATPGAASEPDPERRLDLRKALAALPADQRAAVALCLAAGVSHGDAAELLGLPLGTVKSHVQRGRTALLAILKDEDHER